MRKPHFITTIKLTAGALALSTVLAGRAAAQFPTFITPNGAGGYVVTQPGSLQPPTFINPNGAGGYNEIQPGRLQPFTFINPNGTGGWTINHPGGTNWPSSGSDDDGDDQ